MAYSEQLPVQFPDENTALRIILEGTAAETGEQFFEALVINLAKVLNTHSAWVTEFIEETRRLRALAFWVDGQLIRDFEMEIGRFMTLYYLSIEPAQRQLFWVRTGQSRRLFMIPLGKEFAELKGDGLALGVDETFVYPYYLKTGLAAGQIIAIGTDGSWEACNRDGKMYGQERFRDIIRPDLPANAILEAVYDDVNFFILGRKRQDDMTLVVIKVEEGLGAAGDWQI